LEYVNDKICVGLFIEDAVQDRHIVGVFLTLAPSRQAALELGHDNAALISRNSEAFATEDETTVAFGLGKDLELALMKQYRHILREQEVPQLQLACENSNTCRGPLRSFVPSCFVTSSTTALPIIGIHGHLIIEGRATILVSHLAKKLRDEF